MLFLEPIFIEKIWGGEGLKNYGYKFISHNIGEIVVCGGINENSDTLIKSGVFKELRLSFVWKFFPNLFNNFPSKEFPILIKFISAVENLSIQVHPTEEYAKIHNIKSKTEAWYILETSNDKKVIFGHNATTKAELITFINKKRWNELINEVTIVNDDVLLIKPGTVHAIKAGTILYEIQEPSLVTYRLYDYDRIDLKTKQPRELHIQQAIDNINFPQKFLNVNKSILETEGENISVWMLIKSDYFISKKVVVNCKKDLKLEMFTEFFAVLTMIQGKIVFSDHEIIKGDTIILTKDEISNFHFYGKGEFIISAPLIKNK